LELNVRKPLIAGNWKMNTTLEEAGSLAQAILNGLDGDKYVENVLCPPFVSLYVVKEVLKGTTIKLGAQNMYFEDKGAFTGEISPAMITGLCDYVILGHSERRQYFQETDEIVNRKVKKALAFGVKPIFCVGENLKENEAGETEEVITKQVRAGLSGLMAISELVIAYEPIWAIGTGKAATGKQANNTISLIRHTLASLWDEAVADNVRILYGGSVTASNIAEFVSEPDIDGALVGGASLKDIEFLSIIKQTAELKSTR
jgi:triosephosphate isomerase (TIM)